MLPLCRRRLLTTVATITSNTTTSSSRAIISRYAFNKSLIRAYASGHDNETVKLDPNNFGPGAKPGETPTDLNQSTGLERYELLEMMAGREPWDLKPLEVTHMGTKKNPIVIQTVDPERFIGCTGYPADSHPVLWLTVTHEHDFDRCPECGCVYKYQFIGEGKPGDGHH